MIKEAIIKIVDKQDLSYDEAYQVMNEIMRGGNQPDTKRRLFSGSLN
jgi:anthranilate phosphoribosyltransferase